MTEDEKQALHEWRQAADESHDISSCACCCIDCEVRVDEAYRTEGS